MSDERKPPITVDDPMWGRLVINRAELLDALGVATKAVATACYAARWTTDDGAPINSAWSGAIGGLNDTIDALIDLLDEPEEYEMPEPRVPAPPPTAQSAPPYPPSFILDPYGEVGPITADAGDRSYAEKLLLLANWFDLRDDVLDIPADQREMQADLRRIAAYIDTPLLGMATTEELLTEVAVRMEVTQNSNKGRDLGGLCREALANLDPGVLGYRTVGPFPSVAAEPVEATCSHCGERVMVGSSGEAVTHDWPKPTRQVCPGSGRSTDAEG